jgi:hypothetical protein
MSKDKLFFGALLAATGLPLFGLSLSDGPHQSLPAVIAVAGYCHVAATGSVLDLEDEGGCLEKSFTCSSASTPPVIGMGAKGAFAAISALVNLNASNFAGSWRLEAPKTRRPSRDQMMAPMHITQGSAVA